jgi:hypothetical protein
LKSAHGQSLYGTAFSLGGPNKRAPEPSGRTAIEKKCGNE